MRVLLNANNVLDLGLTKDSFLHVIREIFAPTLVIRICNTLRF